NGPTRGANRESFRASGPHSAGRKRLRQNCRRNKEAGRANECPALLYICIIAQILKSVKPTSAKIDKENLKGFALCWLPRPVDVQGADGRGDIGEGEAGEAPAEPPMRTSRTINAPLGSSATWTNRLTPSQRRGRTPLVASVGPPLFAAVPAPGQTIMLRPV